MKKVLLAIMCCIGMTAWSADYTVVAVKIDGLPNTKKQFSVYCGGTHIGNCDSSWWHNESTIKKNNLLISVNKENNKLVIHRGDMPFDEFSIDIDSITYDGQPHIIKGSRIFDPRRAYEYEITVMAEPLKCFVIDSFHAPTQYIQKAHGGDFSFTDPVLFVEVESKGVAFARSEFKPFKGNVTELNAGKPICYLNENFPLIVNIYVGEKEALERVARGVVGGTSCAIVGGVIGGTITGLLTGGFGAPAGAAIGAAIGGGVGATASQLVPVKGARLVATFRFDNSEMIKTQEKIISDDILCDGQTIRLVIKK